MTDYKWRPYQGQIILSCVRCYCKYGISYRDLEEMMVERGVEVDHTPLYRWVQHYAPLMEKRLRWYWKPTLGYRLCGQVEEGGKCVRMGLIMVLNCRYRLNNIIFP